MWLPKTPVKIVPTAIIAEPHIRGRVSGSPSVYGASSTFHTITIPAHAVMIEAAANEYAPASKIGSITPVKKRPSG